MADPQDVYLAATLKTANALKSVAASANVARLSHLTLPEIEALTDQIAQVIPAGNIPGLILNGLIRIEGRQIPQAQQQRHIDLLFRGARALVDKAVYGAMFAGPAAVIMGYQKLLQLAGKDVDATFPNGTWQFYLEFALREDSARHASETIGFQRAITAAQLVLSEVDTLTAWIMAALVTLQTYERLLENEWRERVATTLLRQVVETSDSTTQSVYSLWESQRPYRRGVDAGDEDYPAYRRRKFDEFLKSLSTHLSQPTQRAFADALVAAEREALPAYIRQMNILARLEPATHQEIRTPYSLAESGIAIIYHGHYILVPTLSDGQLTSIHLVRRLVARLFNDPAPAAAGLDLLLVNTHRTAQADLRLKVSQAEQAALTALGYTPIILNWERQDGHLPLAMIRRGQRGIGDHALTLFFTHDSTIFDQSHIFFDGAWGAALAEIMTNEALSWAAYLSQLPPAFPSASPPQRLEMTVDAELSQAASRAQLGAEAAAEATTIQLASALGLRHLFKRRNDLITVTLNDLLVLYRSVHGQRYTPSPELMIRLNALQADPRPETREVYRLVMEAAEKIRRLNPAILIPMDASVSSPRDRLFPTTFRNPLNNLLQQHDATLTALRDYRSTGGDRTAVYAVFDEQQRTYLRMIASFGIVMHKYKDIALSGQSISTASIKLLAYMPEVMKRLLDQIPTRFDVLNEIIKGEEVFSNVGRVAKGSTLRRFITAKDDNQQKTLAWGVLTDDLDVVHLSLRDFRPHVSVLYNHGMSALANRITQDFLDSYAEGFNRFIRELREITVASRQTRLRQDKDGPD